MPRAAGHEKALCRLRKAMKKKAGILQGTSSRVVEEHLRHVASKIFMQVLTKEEKTSLLESGE
eukprot:2375243-Prorocentrum_lima.AAC.1